MNVFPTTNVSTLGGTTFADSYDQFRTNIEFTPGRWKRREYIPDYIHIEQAELVVLAASGPLQIEFPRGRKLVHNPQAQTPIDVTQLIAVGRHTFAVFSTDGSPFQVQLNLTVRRPTVDTADAGYIVSYENLRYSRKLLLEDDRNSQRVGRFETWVKTLPDTPEQAKPVESVSLNGQWKMRHLPERSVEDLSVPWLDDGDWQTVEVPSKLEELVDDTDGYYWFRTRVVVPSDWESGREPVRFRSLGADDETYVYVNGHEVGYNGGWHRPFQFDIGHTLQFGGENIIAVRVRIRKPRFIFYDGGITYKFVRKYAQNTYPEKTEPLGGLFGNVEISRDAHGGPVRWVPRFYPALENETTVTMWLPEDGGPVPLSLGTESSFTYGPPVMAYHGLAAGEARFTVGTMAGFDESTVFFTVEPATQPPAGKSTGIIVRVNDINHEVDLKSAGSDPVVIALRQNGTVGTGPEARRAYDRQHHLWEDQVYGETLPLNVSTTEAAYVRSLKQTLSLVTKSVDGEIAGLFTDLIKYPIFWLRDAAISIPGTLYGGRIAHRGAVDAAGEIYSRSKENANYTILYPDGTMKPQQRADDAPPLAVYSIYKAWCYQGDAWLKKYYTTVVSYMDYLDTVEREYGNEPDGIIRSSDGDWWDYKYDPRYEREGAVFYVNVLYLRALKYAARMAEAMNDTERRDQWNRRLQSGVSVLNKPVAEGGLFLQELRYFADTVTRHTDTHPNGYRYPDDMDSVTVMTGFRPIPHSIALSEGFVTDPAVARDIVELMDRYPILRPFPAMVQYPWYDFMGNEGIGGEYETSFFHDKWKALPGNQATGGRWGFAAGIVEKALWQNGAARLAEAAFSSAAGSTTLARQPARIIEDAHSSGLFRNEAGSALDPEGFYYNWGSATPMEALVEGKYGITPIPGGVRLSPQSLPEGQGVVNVPVPNGTVTLKWADPQTVHVSLQADRPVRVVVAQGAQSGDTERTIAPPGSEFTVVVADQTDPDDAGPASRRGRTQLGGAQQQPAATPEQGGTAGDGSDR